MKNKVRAHAIISGRVQGVFFRMETKRAADGFGVFGWEHGTDAGEHEAGHDHEPKSQERPAEPLHACSMAALTLG